jgi:hypothetical protein
VTRGGFALSYIGEASTRFNSVVEAKAEVVIRMSFSLWYKCGRLLTMDRDDGRTVSGNGGGFRRGVSPWR